MERQAAGHSVGRPPNDGVRIGPLWLIALLGAGLLAARLLTAGYGSFTENDSISIAAGVAALRRGAMGDFYRYGPQVGYYRLVALVNQLTGGNFRDIPVVMVSLSVISGTVIPLLGLSAFRLDLTRAERWLLAATLAASPVLWMSSRYGNSALPSVAMVVAALTILSNAPARPWELVALALFGAGIVVRADAVLATPAVAVLLWRNHGAVRASAVRVIAIGAAVAAIYALLFAVDPRMKEILSSVRSHLGNEFDTMFWEYLLWSISPIPLAFAVLGLREMVPERRWLLASVVAWVLPVFAFYFRATTTPRYFLLTIFPIAIATAVGMSGVVRLAGRRRTLAWVGVLAIAFVHLLIGLGRYVPSHPRSMLREASFPTHVGPMWTGALLYKSYVQNGIAVSRLLHPRFGSGNAADQSMTAVFSELESGSRRGKHIVLLPETGYGNVLHFYAQAAGVRVLSRGVGPLFNGDFEMEFGGARLSLVGFPPLVADTATRLPVEAGDELWLIQRDSSSVPLAASRLPAGLRLGAPQGMRGAPRVTRFRVERAA